jgi:hypothetical protein
MGTALDVKIGAKRANKLHATHYTRFPLNSIKQRSVRAQKFLYLCPIPLVDEILSLIEEC